MSVYKAVFNGKSLVHYNKNHSTINGQFIRGDGDGDGKADEHHRYGDSQDNYTIGKSKPYKVKTVSGSYEYTKGPLEDHKARTQKIESMSDEELQEANKRFKLEENYKKNFPTKSQQYANMADSASKGLGNASNVVRNIKLKETKNPRADLSKISDAELRKILNREQMERQYDQYFNAPQVNNGQKFVDGLGTTLGIASAVAGLAVAGFTIYSGIKNK